MCLHESQQPNNNEIDWVSICPQIREQLQQASDRKPMIAKLF